MSQAHTSNGPAEITRQVIQFALDSGTDDAGIARASDYQSEKTRQPAELLPGIQSVLVLAYRVLSSRESPSPVVALNGYLDLSAFARTNSYRIARFLETHFGAKIVSIPTAAPFEIRATKLPIADFSHRHAAIAAGLGMFGRHNLVIHPRFGTRVYFASILTDLRLEPTPRLSEELCLNCNLCVDNCPSGALAEEGKTDVARCAAHSLPYNRTVDNLFWAQLLQSPADKQKEMLMSEHHAHLRQARLYEPFYQCFNCMKSCPVGQ